MSAARPEAGTAVGVVVVVRDGERYLADALGSVLEQDPAPAQVVVVDDGSTDSTPSILRSFGSTVELLTQPPSGQGTGLNLGVGAIRTPLVTFLDADDLMVPGSLQARLRALDGPAAADAVFGHVSQFVSPDIPAEAAARFRADGAPVAGGSLCSMLARREVLDRVGPFDPDLRACGPDWLARALSADLRRVTVPDVVARRRIHATNMSLAEGRDGNRHLIAVARAHRRRHREDGGGRS